MLDKYNTYKKIEIINEKEVVGILSVALYQESVLDKFDFSEQIKECKSNVQVMEQIFKYNFAEFPIDLSMKPLGFAVMIFKIVVNNHLN
jgi:hypothetical protein